MHYRYKIRLLVGDGISEHGTYVTDTAIAEYEDCEVKTEDEALELCKKELKKRIKKELHSEIQTISRDGLSSSIVNSPDKLMRCEVITNYFNSDGDEMTKEQYEVRQNDFDCVDSDDDYYSFMYVGFEKINERTLTLYDVFAGITCESADDYWIESLKRNDLDTYVSDYAENMLSDNEEIYLSQDQIDLICEKLLHFYRTDSGSCFSAFWYDNYKMPLSEIEI